MRTVWPRLTTGLAAGLVARAAAQRLRRRLTRTQATAEGLEELALRIAECHSPGDAGRGEEEDQGWGDCLRAALTSTSQLFAAGSGDTELLCAAFHGSLALVARQSQTALTRPTRQADHYRGRRLVPRQVNVLQDRWRVAVLDAQSTTTAQTGSSGESAKPTKYPASRDHLHAFQPEWTAGADGASARWTRRHDAARGASDRCSFGRARSRSRPSADDPVVPVPGQRLQRGRRKASIRTRSQPGHTGNERQSPKPAGGSRQTPYEWRSPCWRRHRQRGDRRARTAL